MPKKTYELKACTPGQMCYIHKVWVPKDMPERACWCSDVRMISVINRQGFNQHIAGLFEYRDMTIQDIQAIQTSAESGAFRCYHDIVVALEKFPTLRRLGAHSIPDEQLGPDEKAAIDEKKKLVVTCSAACALIMAKAMQ